MPQQTKTGVTQGSWITDDFSDIKYLVAGRFRNRRQLACAFVSGTGFVVAKVSDIKAAESERDWETIKRSEHDYEHVATRVQEALEADEHTAEYFLIGVTSVDGIKALTFKWHR